MFLRTSRAFSGDIQKRWTDANRKDGAGQISTVRNNKKSPASDFLASLSLSKFMRARETISKFAQSKNSRLRVYTLWTLLFRTDS